MAGVTSKRGDERPARVSAIDAAITAFAFLDAYTVGLFIAVLAAWLPALIVFAVAAVVLTFINGACCGWVERQWDAWIAGNAKRIEATLAKAQEPPHAPSGGMDHARLGRVVHAGGDPDEPRHRDRARPNERRPAGPVRAAFGWPRPATQSSSRPCFQRSGSPLATRSARHTAGLDTGSRTGSNAEGGDHRPGRSGGLMPRQMPAPGHAIAVRSA